MKYIFEISQLDNSGNSFEIKAEAYYGSFNNGTSKVLTFNKGEKNNNDDFDHLLNNLVDDIRLTVKERNEALTNTEILKWYIKQYINIQEEPILEPTQEPAPEQIINENDRF